MGGTAAPRKLMLLLLGVRTRGRWFDSDLVHHAVSANRVFGLIRGIHRRRPALSQNGRLVSGLRSPTCAHSNAAFSALAYGVSDRRPTARRARSVWRSATAIASEHGRRAPGQWSCASRSCARGPCSSAAGSRCRLHGGKPVIVSSADQRIVFIGSIEEGQR
jgi:hypothetical protein